MTTSALLEVKGLSVSFGGQEVVHGIDFSIKAGEKLALVGESGSGKTVSALSLLRLVHNADVSGSAVLEGRDLLQLLHEQLVRQPVAPELLRAELPLTLSRIILRLLEKEPERRYQSAEGLAHDLTRVKQALAEGDATPLRLGEHDVPLQLSAPAHLVGRDAEIGALRQALDEAVQGQGRIVLVAGAPGVGKTSLINELRPMVTARRG